MSLRQFQVQRSQVCASFPDQQDGWAIRRAKMLLPFDVLCLPQTLIGRWMPADRGIPSAMYFGVKKSKAMYEVGTYA